jgi:ABC-type molybdate transport system permease subunit
MAAMENQFKPANGLEQFARQSFEFLCWIEDRVVWPLVISPSLLVGFLTVVLMRRGRSSGF